MADRLSGELLDAANNRGNAVKKREDTHRWPKPTAPSRTTAGMAGALGRENAAGEEIE
jgi:hypothetical protein